MEKQGITLNLTDDARKNIAMQGFTPRYGVRPLKGVIRNLLRRPVSRMIISGEASKGAVIDLSTDENGEILWKIHQAEDLLEQN
jgi:ATP-dependent Clp protease ATP-binding subunit ClpA